MTDGDDLVRTWWVTTAAPYVDRVVPKDEIDRITGDFVWPKPEKTKHKDAGLRYCRECEALYDVQGSDRTYCRPLCKVTAMARKRAARRGCT